jgi:hypothetical protein
VLTQREQDQLRALLKKLGLSAKATTLQRRTGATLAPFNEANMKLQKRRSSQVTRG